MDAPTEILVQVSLAPKKPTPLLRSLSRALPLSLSFPSSPPPTVRDVKNAVHKALPGLYPARQKLALPDPDPESPQADYKTQAKSKALADESALLFDAAGKVELLLSDLGPQADWRTVYVVEYIGPLVIHPLVYYLPRLVYGRDVQHSALQTSVYAMVMLHFLKRELETLFVHRFSHDTMPFRNIYKNCGHYWIFSGLLLALDIYRPGFSAPALAGTWRASPRVLQIGWAVWAYAELSNLFVHLKLRAMRPAGTTTRAIPTGYGFSAPFNVAYPNYFFEMVAWCAVCGITGSVSALVFMVLGSAQMLVWALKKHRAYKREFGDKYPRGRRAMIPYVL